MGAAAMVASAYPEFVVPMLFAGYLGGIFPDIDLFVGSHRRTLHYPVYYWGIVGLFAVVTLWSPSLISLCGLCFFLAAALHSGMDIFGAGVEARPWERTNPRAVYVHPIRRWAPAKYYIQYDGSPRDLMLVVLVTVPLLYVDYSLLTSGLLVVGVAISVGYTVIRRRLPTIEARLMERGWWWR